MVFLSLTHSSTEGNFLRYEEKFIIAFKETRKGSSISVKFVEIIDYKHTPYCILQCLKLPTVFTNSANNMVVFSLNR